MLNDELSTGYEEIVGHSDSIKQIFKLIDQISESESAVLIYGESGTGKELIARAIHHKSKRSEKPLVKINCGALNDNLLESELFGHEKGAFTGAVRQKKGRFELADGGTLFLDEIGDISQGMQVKLLRVIQEGEFERVGGEKTLNSDVRIISATNKDLEKCIADGTFREDLYYRLSVIPVTIPSLRDRKEDIPLLADYFLQKLAVKYHRPQKQVDDKGMDVLAHYPWPGNIRELENLIERLFFISQSEIINSELLASHLMRSVKNENNFETLPLDEALFAFEKHLLTQAMKRADGVKNRAAKLLGINTSTLYYKLEKYGMIK